MHLMKLKTKKQRYFIPTTFTSTIFVITKLIDGLKVKKIKSVRHSLIIRFIRRSRKYCTHAKTILRWVGPTKLTGCQFNTKNREIQFMKPNLRIGETGVVKSTIE